MFHPDQVKGRVQDMLRSRDYILDYWDGDPRCETYETSQVGSVYYLRPRNLNELERGNVASFSSGFMGQCVLLTEHGCSLEHKDRPYACQMLMPQDGKCIDTGLDKQALCVLWIDLQHEV
jgi:hypothetical protein